MRLEQGLGEGVQGPRGTGDREDESAHAKFFCDQAETWWTLSPAASLDAIFENLSTVGVLSIFWLL